MPRIWTMYLRSLTDQKIVTRTRKAFDRALCALPVTQHDMIWELYLVFVSQRGVPIETSFRVYRRYLKYDPGHIEDLIEFLLSSGLWQEAGETLALVLNDDTFWSIKGKTKYMLWLELCDVLANHATATRLNVDAILRGGIRKYNDEVGRLWTSLADYYIRRKLLEKARDVFEEGMTTMEVMSEDEEEEEDGGKENGVEDEGEDEEDNRLNLGKLKEKLKKFLLCEEKDVDLRIARLVHLMERRPELANSVLLRQNPHNIEQWHRRVKIFEGNPTKQILTYTEAVRTIDPMKSIRLCKWNYKAVDNLASVWCEWAEMELRHKNFKGALELMRLATAEPSAEVKRR
ncbi:pre-mRNA-splicing factor SYF1, partial [Tanacetum coccineum]